MIELRWLVRRVRRPVGIDDGMYSPHLDPMIHVPTLQYRDWPPGCISGNIEPQWVDVPTVREP